jgi:hypothetical protein
LDDDIKLLKDDIFEKIIEGQYVVQLNSKIRNVKAAIERITKMAGGNVKYVYTNAFLGVSLFNMSDFLMTQILNSKIVFRAARVRLYVFNFCYFLLLFIIFCLMYPFWRVDKIELEDLHSEIPTECRLGT